LILQVWKYKNSSAGINNVYKNNSHRELSELLSLMSAATNIPIVACSYFLEEIVGKSDELDNIRNRLISFYKYEKVELKKPEEI
jgi:hypothetical protein